MIRLRTDDGGTYIIYNDKDLLAIQKVFGCTEFRSPIRKLFWEYAMNLIRNEYSGFINIGQITERGEGVLKGSIVERLYFAKVDGFTYVPAQVS